MSGYLRRVTRSLPRRAALALLASSLAAACARTPAEPARYPALPAGASASSAIAAFEPDPALVATTFACRADEPSLDNALDDDCDGRIDGAPADAPLALTLAYPRALPLTLIVRSDGGEEQQLTLLPCSEERAFCTARLEGEALPRGRHVLLARTGDAHARGAPLSLLVAAQGHGKVSTYLVPLAEDDSERALGRLSLP